MQYLFPATALRDLMLVKEGISRVNPLATIETSLNGGVLVVNVNTNFVDGAMVNAEPGMYTLVVGDSSPVFQVMSMIEDSNPFAEVTSSGNGNTINITIRKIVNLCPHALNIITNTGITINIPTSGTLARVSQSTVELGNLCGFRMVKTLMGEVENLPEAVPYVYYVVSRLVKGQAMERPDVICVGELTRNTEGAVTGANGFSM